MKLLPAGP